MDYFTEPHSAVAPIDYEHIEGTLEFETGENSKFIEVRVNKTGRYQRTDNFRLILENIEGGAVFDPHSDGGETQAICTIEVGPNS